MGTDYGHADSATELLAIEGVANDPQPEPGGQSQDLRGERAGAVQPVRRDKSNLTSSFSFVRTAHPPPRTSATRHREEPRKGRIGRVYIRERVSYPFSR